MNVDKDQYKFLVCIKSPALDSLGARNEDQQFLDQGAIRHSKQSQEINYDFESLKHQLTHSQQFPHPATHSET